MRSNFYKLIFSLSVLAFSSCNNSAEKTEDIVVAEEQSSVSSQTSKFNAQNVFNTLPDRKLVLKLIEENKIDYNPDLLNDPTAVNKYTVEFFKAVNLGIYGSDLSIASSFDQTQESMVFLKCVNALATNLGVNSAFDQRMFDRIQANDNNKDSVLQIVTDAFRKVDEILKNNNRPATSAVILSGCWIEGLYVSCQMAQQANAESIIKTILQQKESLRNLIAMLEAVQLEESSKFILTDLKSLHDTFDVAETNTKYDKKSIEKITKKITDLRTAMVNAATSSSSASLNSSF
jgi:hypothetical protein